MGVKAAAHRRPRSRANAHPVGLHHPDLVATQCWAIACLCLLPASALALWAYWPCIATSGGWLVWQAELWSISTRRVVSPPDAYHVCRKPRVAIKHAGAAPAPQSALIAATLPAQPARSAWLPHSVAQLLYYPGHGSAAAAHPPIPARSHLPRNATTAHRRPGGAEQQHAAAGGPVHRACKRHRRRQQRQCAAPGCQRRCSGPGQHGGTPGSQRRPQAQS